MPAVRTLTALGAALGQQIAPLAKVANRNISRDLSLSSDESLQSLETLLDRLCLSMTLAKPVGLMAWAERESPRMGRAGVIDMMRAATNAVEAASAAGGYGVEQRRLLAFLEVLTREVERVVLGADADDTIGDDGTNALLTMLAERDYGTCCHSKATAEWARRLALSLDCEPETAEFIGLCGLLHDIGKIATPDDVLLKPSPLTASEWDVMRDHAAAGARILNQLPALQRCAMIVRAHHERYDGAGYPDGLAGTAIPFEARVVAVADAFHAMISDRPYRRGLPPRQALILLEEGRGSQWDPEVVDAMLGMFRRRTTIASHAEQASSA
jgi:putative nucleotidyltransferase with HDIG domain